MPGTIFGCGMLATLVNSDGWLELYCNQARADKLAKAKLGERVEVMVPALPNRKKRRK